MADQAAPATSLAAPNPHRKRKRAPNSTSGPKEPKPKPIECPVCLTPRIPRLIHTLSNCNCTYCTYCIREVFTAALQRENGVSNYPAMCCGRVVDYDLFEPQLTTQLRRVYKSRIEEEGSLRDDRVYCGNQKCKLYILKANIKDGFGSCSTCKMKSCVKPECNRPMAEHLGIHTICPDDLETQALKKLAREKGWKRCPKCYALTERTRGCNDIRCICKTEWCYTCGKAVKGTKNPCQCHPPPPPRLTPRAAEDDIQIEREVIIVQDDVDMVDVKPSIEDIEGRPQPNFHTKKDFPAELNHRTGISGRSSSGQTDVVAELDNLAAPNTRGRTGIPSQAVDQDSASRREGSSSFVVDSGTDTAEESLEDMLQAFNSYQAPLAMEDVTLDLSNVLIPEHFEDSPVQIRQGRTGSALPDTPLTPLMAGAADTTDLNEVAENARVAPAQNSDDRIPEAVNSARTSDVSLQYATSSAEQAETNLETTAETPSDVSQDFPDLRSNITQSRDASSQPTQMQETTASVNGPEWLMDSIEEYLGVHGGEIKVERSGNE